MSSYTLASLFDGSGGFPLAGALCGIEPRWASEVEPYPIAVTRSRFPDMKHYGDVSKIKGAEVEPVDIITFGSPCQDLSVAGKRAGLKHEANGDEETTRSGLFMEAVRIIKEMREATNGIYPRVALWENVPGAFSSNKGEDFRIVCEELIKIVEPRAVMPPVPKNGWAYADCYIGDGWSLAYRVFDAQYWGVPQRRRRIYLVADFGGECAGQISFERKSLRGYFAEGRTPWQGAAGNAQNCSGADDREGAVPYTLKVRTGRAVDSSGKAAGKGALIQRDKAATLAVTQDQYLFQPVGINGDVAGTLDASYFKGCGMRQGVEREVIAIPIPSSEVVEPTAHGIINLNKDDIQSKAVLDPAGIAPALYAGECRGGGGECYVLDKSAIPIHDQATRFSGKRGDKSDGKGNGLGIGQEGDPMNTLTSGDRHAVCYTMQGFGDYKDCGVASGLKARDYKDATDLVCGVDCRNGELNGDLCGTLQAKPNGGFSYNCTNPVIIKTPVRYIVRRLTPTECARLQGFPDKWGHPDQKEDFTYEEYRFWHDVRNTHAAINGKPVKEYTKAQMLTWYNKLHTDSSEYKMWGNGIALPTALYVMQGIADALEGGANG